MKSFQLLTFVIAAVISMTFAKSSACFQPSSIVGICRAKIPSWSYNSQSNSCEFFNYGGCQGNANRFPSKAACEPAVMAVILTEDGNSLCALPPSRTGMCRARIPAWSFNGETEQCEKFIFGGCGGNLNRFASQSRCEEQCLENVKTYSATEIAPIEEEIN
ncbi:inter-alpha-trypsin inhibitor-like [Musca vetustissima]|uniref:inter-alpha-trypsin inhibitor-like n=1 Tax=Musca vetustissima TaxID=27455 RepID=UPI002AB73C0F|nr:inter-alpha-trypsin inhibitor-like [Musca vetustissima]